MRTVKEISDLTGISVRTLHYYDEIGLLKPTKKSDAGYRLYDDKALETLQQVLFFREFDIPLKEIKAVMENPVLERNQILQMQRKMLVAKACRELGYEPVLLTDQLCCEAREAGSFLGSIVRTHAGQGKKLACIAGGETVVHLTGKGLGGRNQELSLAAAPALAGLDAAVFSVGSDGTDGPTDAAGGYVDGDTLSALTAKGWNVFDTLQNNDAYHALKAVDGLIITGATGTNVNDAAVALVGEK